MRLLEMIVSAIPRGKIPQDAQWFMQDKINGVLKFSRFNEKPDRGEVRWYRGIVCIKEDTLGEFKVADDATENVITREELMRAYDLVEQGCTLWFGGECPVAAGSFVDVVYGDGEIFSSYDATALSWKTVIEPNNIIAYKIADIKPDEKPSIIERSSPSSPILCDLMRDISNSMPEMMAADMIDLADYLIAQGWGKHE